MPVDVTQLQGGPINNENGITQEIMNNNNRQKYGPITLSNGAIYTGELKAGMKDGDGQQIWLDGSKYNGYWRQD